MKKVVSLFLSLVILISTIGCVDLSAYADETVGTSTGYRYTSKYSDVIDKYSDFQKINNSTFAVPGLENTNVLGDTCDCMTPQGICVAGDYILITAYCSVKAYKDDLKSNSSNGSNAEKLEKEGNHSKHSSVIYVVSKFSKKYLTTLVLPDRNHVGGIAYDGNYVWIAKSTDEQLSAVLLSDIVNAVSTGKDSVLINYYANVYCDCIASFVITYQNKLWVGVCNSDGTGIGIMRGFTVSGDTADTLELTAIKELTIPEKANGAAFATIDGETCLAVNSSYGRNNDTTTYLYTVDLESDSDISVYTNYGTHALPPMAEEICIDGSDVYTLFESASTAYSCVDGNKCNNIVDRVCISSLTDWFYWTSNDYQDEEEIIKPPSVTDTDMAYEPTSAEDAKYLNTYLLAHDINRTMYNPYTASMALDMSNVAYKIGTDDTWSTSMSKYGYSQIKRVENNAVYTLGSKVTEDGTVQNLGTSVNATVGLKKVIYNGQTKYCVAIAFRGTDMTDFADVITDINLIPNGNGIHTGFADVANDFTRDCDNIKFKIEGKTVTLAEMILDMKTEGSKYQLLVTGHSLGGAVADVFVAQNLVKTNEVDPSNVVAYTFAAASSVSSSYSYNHHNIINIINADDIVPTIGGSMHIGDNITFTPDDAFRETNYGSNYVEGHTSAWWINAVDSASTGFVAHKLKPVYSSIIKDIESNLTNYTSLNTETIKSTFWTLKFNKNCFSNFSGDVELASLIFDNACVEIGGNFLANGGFYGNASLLVMTNEDDYLKVNGNFSLKTNAQCAQGFSTQTTAGTIEVIGDFLTVGDGYGGCFNSTGTHKVILSGNNLQKVSVTGYYGYHAGFNVLELNNKSDDGVIFLDNIRIKTLFNHNNCKFVFHEYQRDDGYSNVYFPDYDGDGLKDNEDPYPTINPVESIQFIPRLPYVYMQNVGGSTVNYFNYIDYLYDCNLHDGDIVKISFIDGTEKEYIYTKTQDSYQMNFIDSSANILDISLPRTNSIFNSTSAKIEDTDPQFYNPWNIGKENNYIFEVNPIYYSDGLPYQYKYQVKVPILLKENNVKSIDYEPIESYIYNENDLNCGTYNYGDYFYYYYFGKKPGDKLTVNYKDGTTTIYTCTNDYRFIDENDNLLYLGEDLTNANQILNFDSNQHNEHWMSNKENNVTVTYMGVTTTVPVEIIHHEYETITEIAPTCEENGQIIQSCKLCDYNFVYEVKALGHNFINNSNQCTRCGHIHKYLAETSQASCLQDGYTYYYCEECGDSYYSDYTEAIGHNYVDKVCVNCGEETLYSYFDTSKISSVSFEPVSEYRIMENTNGYWDSDQDGNDYYFYYSLDYKDGDKLIAVLNDGSKETFIYHYYSYDYQGFFNDKEEVVLLLFDSDQYTEHWTVGGENIVNLTVTDYNYNEITSTQTTVTIYANPYSSITYVPANELKFIENMNGSVTTDNDGNEYYNYSELLNNGDQIILTTKDGENSIYTYRDDVYSYSDDYVYASFFNESNESVSVKLNHNQSEIHWQVGKQYDISVECLDLSTTIKASVVENPVKSLEFIPIDDKTIIEQTNGNWVNDGDGEDGELYWDYYTPISEGDKLIVTNKDGSTVEYTYVEWIDSETNNCFISENGGKISRHECVIDNQYSTHWEVDKENYFTVEYMGVSCQVPVTIVKPDHEHHYIAEIIEPTCVDDGYIRYYCEFCENEYHTDYTEPTGNHTYVNGFCKYCNAKDDNYVLPTISASETKTVNIENGGEYYYFSFTPETDGTYIFSSDSDIDTYGYLYDENMNELTYDDDSGKNNNFSIRYDFESGKTYIFGCRYYSKEDTGSFDVSLIENTVKSISYTSIKPYKIIENTCGYEDERWYTDDDGNEYCEYYWRYHTPYFSEGDILTVTDKNGIATEYTYVGYSEDYERSVFLSKTGEIIYADEIRRNDNQSENQWTIDGDNYFTVTYFGKSCNVPVSIVENPVDSISYEPISPITVMDGVSYKLPYCGTDNYVRVGDKLFVNYKNGTVKEFIAEQNAEDQDTDRVYFVSSDGESINLDRWNDDSIGISYNPIDESILQFTYCGVSTTVEMIRIFAEKITYAPVKSVVIDENDFDKIQEGMYWNREDEIGNDYTYYSPMPFWKELNDDGDVEILSNIIQSGDTLVVEYSNGETITYTYNNKSGEWGYRFDGDDNTELYLRNPDGGYEDELNIIDNQKTDHWEQDGNNWFAIKLSGVGSNKVPVEIVKKDETHTHSYVETVTEPTCTEKGYTTYTCSCGNSYVDNYVDAVGHNYGQWTYNGDAVYNSSSDYKNGTQTRVCSVCGEEETIEAPNTALLRRRGTALSLESSITLTTYITKDVVDYYDDVYAEFTRNGKTEIVRASDKTFKSGSTVYNVFDYTGISPQAMGDDVEVVFYGIKDGVKYWGNPYSISATSYIHTMLNTSTSSEKLKTMLVDLLYYGEACQIYQNYKTDNLMTNILTEEQKQLRSTGELKLNNIRDASYQTCENRLVRLGSALRLSNAVEMAIPLNMTDVTLEELNIKVKIGSRNLEYTYADNPENFKKEKDGYWYFYFDGVYANQMSDEVFITAYRGEEPVSYTLKYSVESYASTVTDTKLKNVTDAMMRYGNSAKAYSGK